MKIKKNQIIHLVKWDFCDYSNHGIYRAKKDFDFEKIGSEYWDFFEKKSSKFYKSFFGNYIDEELLIKFLKSKDFIDDFEYQKINISDFIDDFKPKTNESEEKTNEQ